MDTLGLVTFLRTNILDSTGGVGVDWANINATDYDSVQLRWTNEELVANINEAINQVYRRIEPVMEHITILTQAGVNTYALPSYVFRVISVKGDNDVILEETNMEYIWSHPTTNTRFKYYCLQEVTNSLYLFPTPAEDGSIGLLTYRFPLTKLSWTNKTQVPELKEEFLIPMLFFAAHLCYLKDEETVKDPQRAQYFRDMFDREFPFTSAYANVRRSREAKYAAGTKRDPYKLSGSVMWNPARYTGR